MKKGDVPLLPSQQGSSGKNPKMKGEWDEIFSRLKATTEQQHLQSQQPKLTTTSSSGKYKIPQRANPQQNQHQVIKNKT